jgi:hypothetical protein
MTYEAFLERKRMVDPATGMYAPPMLPAFLFPHQHDIVDWALRRGRSAIFAGTGLGKTAMELTWADAVSAHTDKPVLIFAPLAVSQQHIREAEKFGLPARIVKSQDDVRHGPTSPTIRRSNTSTCRRSEALCWTKARSSRARTASIARG